MNLKELENRVRGGENLFTEFKHKINFPEKIAREIVAFSNTQGGWLLIGVDDNKLISGIKNIEEEIFEFNKIITKLIKFSIEYTAFQIPISEKKTVLALQIKESKQKPNFAFEKIGDKTGIAYVRVADKSVQASSVVIKILELQTINKEVRIKFGDIESKTMQIIQKNGFVSVKYLVETLLISNQTATESLINMVLGGILKIIPEEGKEDKFYEI